MEPEPGDERALMLASFAAMGDAAGVRRVLAADPGAVNEVGLDGTTPLCAAALWGNTDIVRILLDAKAAPGLRNESGPRWTALHAAALQEQGKSCMLLLSYQANPVERDTEGITPCDYASCSEGVWPLFAAHSCERVAKSTLVQKGVLRKASAALEAELSEAAQAASGERGLIPEYSRPGSSYVMTHFHPPRPGSALGVGPSTPSSRSSTGRLGTGRLPQRPIDILEEEDEQQVKEVTGGLRSLGI